MSKICVYPWYHSYLEENVIKSCGYPSNEPFEGDPFEVLKKLYTFGGVSVALIKNGDETNGYLIMVCDSTRFGQR